MRYGRVVYMLGRAIITLGCSLLLPLITAWCYPQEGQASLFAVLLPAYILLGQVLCHLSHPWRKEPLRQRDSYLLVSLAWVIASLLGSVPYLLSGCFTDFASAVFESASGFSTTGASAIVDIEAQGHALLLWRSLTH